MGGAPVRRNVNPRARREQRLAAGREAFPAKVRGVRGAITILQDDECADTFEGSGPTSVGPGAQLTTIRPRDSRGRQVPRRVQILPSVSVGQGGTASFPGFRRTETDSVPVLTVADPEVIPAGETAEVTFIGLGLAEEPLTIIVPVTEADVDVDDERVTVENAAWITDPQSQGIEEGFQAITADVTVAADAVVGTRIHYAIEV